MKYLDKMPDWLRWILFLPSSFLALLIIYPTVTIINDFTISMVIGESFFYKIWILIVANFASAIGFIYVGSIMVPKNNFTVSIFLSILYSFLMGASFILRLMFGVGASISWLEMVIIIATGILAAVIMIRYFHDTYINIEEM
ncbi:MAG: hypothetical protein Q7J16_08465 [Candidatus Cloacimonadales bacterium]|nr:hypothetical protein [Candidatus Cloacimonadales bacterium]